MKVLLALALFPLVTACSSTHYIAPIGDMGDGGQDASGGDMAKKITGPDLISIGKKRVFVTSAMFPGDFGGLMTADMTCTNTATTAGLNGMWVAWLSDEATNAIDRVMDVGPWFDLAGNLVFNSLADLKTTPQTGIAYDEKVKPIGTQSGDTWTGTSVGGMAAMNFTCNNWLSTNARGAYGTAGASDNNWTRFGGGANPCTNMARLYCIEQ